MYRLKKILGIKQFLCTLLTATMLLSLFASTASAEAEQDIGIDAMFVLDTSYSMNETDEERISAEVIKMFIDMSEDVRTRFGFVAYNHNIVEAMPLTSLASSQQRKQLKHKIESLRFSGYTDLGLGLRKGKDLLAGIKNQSRKPFMILLSDGGTDIGNNSNRTVQQSDNDVEHVISHAKKQGYPIYTIGLNEGGAANRKQLERIASSTGGTSFITDSAEDLPEIFNKIFANHIKSVLIPVASITGTGQLQEATVNISNSSMNEANIILLSEHPMREAHLYSSSKHTFFNKSKKYSLLKVLNPKKGNMLVKFRAKPGDLVKIYLLGNYSIQSKLEMTPSSVLKGQKTTIGAHLYQPTTGKQVKDKDVYSVMTAELAVKHLPSNKEQRLPLNKLEGGFELQHVFNKSGTYEAKLLLNGPDFYRNSLVTKFDVQNVAPQQASDSKIAISKDDGETKINLLEHFKDQNNDRLTFTIAANNKSLELGDMRVQEQFLTVSPAQSGTYNIKVTADDGDKGTISAELTITVQSIWDVIKPLLAGLIIAIALGLLIYWLTRPKPKFTGRFEGYFLETASGVEYPVKYWPMTSFDQRQRVTLQELFRNLNVNEPLAETDKIWFEPGKNGTMIIKHLTNCTVVRGTVPILANSKEILTYNDKVYITFEDGITEIEIRYKETKTSTP
ncbi:vWA domain-containing protein [Paenibacillus sp. 481]|uniref:vWA domain-containing protein n=1 Tax=Paenibacillus sp. 481 TaxID=2835869 RepID=UPI001E35A57E|nr:vWA domain-containing protein [Paenibacillus sp. 481]UHA72248.1 VWA domain-containing protein [Paenibacillus sp. 481]